MIATNEELALLEKWKRKLCLQEWRIKLLTHLHPEEMMVRNTVLYHLDKIERETKLNPRHIHDLIDLLEIALEVL